MTVTPIETGTEMGPYAPAVVATGPFVFVSGQGSIVDGVYERATVEVETRRALENMAKLLRQAGSRPELLVQCRVFLSDIDDFATMNEAYAEFFTGLDSRPARTTVQAGALPFGALVEIECIAAVAQ